MSSTRLPGKVMMPIVGKPMLWHVVDRVKRTKLIDQVIVATSINSADKKIVGFCKKNNIEVFRGSQNDVLDRYFKCAKKYKADFGVRITADCPLIDPQLIDDLIRKFLKGRYDYMGIATGGGIIAPRIYRFPQGLDAEIFTFNSLAKSWKAANDKVDREHVSVYIWQHPKKFKLGPPLASEKDYSYLRLTVDWKEDISLIKKIYTELYLKKRNFGYRDIVFILNKKPALPKINLHRHGETTKRFWKQKLISEFEKLGRPKKLDLKNVQAVIVLSADETGIVGENKERIIEGLKIIKKVNKNCSFIYVGTKDHNKSFNKFLRKQTINIERFFLLEDKFSNTKTQIIQLSKFAKSHKLKNLLLISHAYHMLRIQRYCKLYVENLARVYYYPIGRITAQHRQVREEIRKIIKYSQYGDLPLFLG